MKWKRNTVTRELAVNPYDIEALEGWLEELAAGEGLRLKSCWDNSFTFWKGDAGPLRYRMAPARMVGFDPGPSRELLELYKSAGWEFVDTYRYDFHIFVSGDPQAVEPYTDTDTQGWALKRLSRRLWLTMPFPTIFYIGMLLLEAYFYLHEPNMYWHSVVWLPYSLLYCLDLGTVLFDMRVLRRLRRQLQEGVPLEQRRPDGAKHVTTAKVRTILRRFYALFLLLLLAYAFGVDKGLL